MKAVPVNWPATPAPWRAMWSSQPSAGADPDGPPLKSKIQPNSETWYELASASLTVIRGRLEQAISR